MTKTTVEPLQFPTKDVADHQLHAWSRRKLVFIGLPACLVLSFLLLLLLLSLAPFDTKLAARTDGHAVNEPIGLELSQAIGADIEATISPEVPGEWRYDRSFLGVRGLTFVPGETGLNPATTYTLRLAGLERVTGQSLPDQKFEIKTEAAPSVASVSPKSDMKDVPADSVLSITLAGPNRGMRELRAEVAPKTELVMEKSADDIVFGWKAKELLAQGKKYEMKVFDTRSGSQEPIATAAFTTAREPKVKATTKGFMYPDKPIDITFDMAMKQEGEVVKCACDGSGKWKSDTVYQFTPAKLEVDKTYAYSVLQGVRSAKGGILEKDQKFKLKTPGVVKADVPMVGNRVALNTPIVVTFDQPVDRAVAQAKFSLSPKAEGGFTWKDDKTMTFTPKKLRQQQNYTVTVASGVKPLKFGKTSDQSFAMQFSTEPKTTKLDVPVLAQQHPSSCEAASLKMALAFRGINDSEANIVRKMGYNGKHKKGNKWDDPNQMYVGNIDGSQSRYEGYGAYGAPIAKAAKAYGRDAHVQYGATPSYVAEQILKGNPVVIIGTVSHMNPSYISWEGPSGKVHAWMGMHARTVVGVVGSAKDPVSFWVNDPYRGTHEQWTPERLANDLATVPQVSSQVVVVK